MKKETFIPSNRVEELVEKVNRLNKKATKLGAKPVELEVLETTSREMGEKGYTYNVDFTKIRVQGEDPVVDGHNLIALIDYDDYGNVQVNEVPDRTLDPKYQASGIVCDNCKQSRHKTEMYALEDPKTKEVKIYGKSCVNSLFGAKKADQLIYMLTWLRLLDAAEREFSTFSTETYPTWTLKQVLACAIHSIGVNGYVSKAKATAIGEFSTLIPTSVDVQALLHGDRFRKTKKYTPSAFELEEAEKMAAWAKTIVPQADEHKFAVKAIAETESCTDRNLGYAVTIVPMYRKANAETVVTPSKTEGVEGGSDFVGNLKERYVFELTFLEDLQLAGFYGLATLYKFSDPKGNVFIWKAPKDQEFVKGQKYSVRGTIKSHTIYGGEKQNVLSHAKFYAIK